MYLSKLLYVSVKASTCILRCKKIKSGSQFVWDSIQCNFFKSQLAQWGRELEQLYCPLFNNPLFQILAKSSTAWNWETNNTFEEGLGNTEIWVINWFMMTWLCPWSYLKVVFHIHDYQFICLMSAIHTNNYNIICMMCVFNDKEFSNLHQVCNCVQTGNIIPQDFLILVIRKKSSWGLGRRWKGRGQWVGGDIIAPPPHPHGPPWFHFCPI